MISKASTVQGTGLNTKRNFIYNDSKDNSRNKVPNIL